MVQLIPRPQQMECCTTCTAQAECAKRMRAFLYTPTNMCCYLLVRPGMCVGAVGLRCGHTRFGTLHVSVVKASQGVRCWGAGSVTRKARGMAQGGLSTNPIAGLDCYNASMHCPHQQ